MGKTGHLAESVHSFVQAGDQPDINVTSRRLEVISPSCDITSDSNLNLSSQTFFRTLSTRPWQVSPEWTLLRHPCHAPATVPQVSAAESLEEG